MDDANHSASATQELANHGYRSGLGDARFCLATLREPSRHAEPLPWPPILESVTDFSNYLRLSASTQCGFHSQLIGRVAGPASDHASLICGTIGGLRMNTCPSAQKCMAADWLRFWRVACKHYCHG
jgi:hypothetical protein